MAINEIIVLDTETSLNNDEVGDFSAHPMCTKNWIVWLGVLSVDPNTFEFAQPILKKFATPDTCAIHAPPRQAGTEVLLVGHNIGFDLHYLCNPNNKYHEEWIAYINDPLTQIWDTQIAEYRIRGMSKVSPSLDWCCEQLGWSTKPGRMKEYWDAGIGTQDIPDEEVRPYLWHDIHTTARLLKNQLMRAQALGMLDLLRIEFQSRMTTIVMERNGMCFDKVGALKALDDEIAPALLSAAEESLQYARRLLPGVKPDAIRTGSTAWLSTVLYGGTIKWKEQLPMMDPTTGEPLYFKSGKKKGEARLRWHDFEHEVQGLSPINLERADEESLNKIMDHAKCTPELAEFLGIVLKTRDLQKQAGTYFTGYSQLTWPDGMIHGNLNHAIAATGRLTSTNPNLQNAGHSPIRKHFKSRYEGGKLLEVDLSQIEVVVQAFLSNDQHMRQDIIDGVDFHSKRAAFAGGAKYEDVLAAVNDETHPKHKEWKAKRKAAKIVSFQKAYGAGVNKIAATTGLSKKEVQAFMDAEDANYPNVPLMQVAWITEVERSTMIRDGATCGILTSPIAAQYRFFQENFNGHLTYKPTTIKNYPIQGLSADILKIILSGLRKVVLDFNAAQRLAQPVLMVITVHDSVVFDVPTSVDIKQLASVLIEHFTQYPVTVLKDVFGVDFNIPISADADVGDNWHEMKGVSA